MAYINTAKKWLYLFEPHTASRATTVILDMLGGSKIGHHHIGIPELTNVRRQHIAANQIAGMDVIVTVRNPFDVLITRWMNTEHRDKPFERWFDKYKHHEAVTTPLTGLYASATRICWYENLENDLYWVLTGLEPAKPKPKKLERNSKHVTTGKKNWNTYYTPEMIQQLLPHYDGFLQQYGYKLHLDKAHPRMELDQETRKRHCRPIKIMAG